MTPDPHPKGSSTRRLERRRGRSVRVSPFGSPVGRTPVIGFSGKAAKQARIAAFGSTRHKGTLVGKDAPARFLVKAGTPVLPIPGRTRVPHATEGLEVEPRA